jgi:hypothetical protein
MVKYFTVALVAVLFLSGCGEGGASSGVSSEQSSEQIVVEDVTQVESVGELPPIPQIPES